MLSPAIVPHLIPIGDGYMPRKSLECAVMDNLWEYPFYRTINKTRITLEKELEQIAKVTAWAQGLKDEEGKEYYLKWLDHFKAEHEEQLSALEKESNSNVVPINIPKPPIPTSL